MSKINEQLPRLYNLDDAVWGSADLEKATTIQLIHYMNSLLDSGSQLKLKSTTENTKASQVLNALNEGKVEDVVRKDFEELQKIFKEAGFGPKSPEMKMLKDLEAKLRKEGVI